MLFPDGEAARRDQLTRDHGESHLADTANALRCLGLRNQIHPDDAIAFTYRNKQAAQAWQASSVEHHGLTVAGLCEIDGEWVGVYDLRPRMKALYEQKPKPYTPTDPTLPDNHHRNTHKKEQQ